MTFSRRAAGEMNRRVERIVRQVSGDRAGAIADALIWAGTFHGIGARLLRIYAGQIGLDPAFTIHDREDSADLMNLIRHELGLSKTESRFPAKGTCLAIYSRCVNAELPIEDVLWASFPWCSSWAAELKKLFACLCRGEAAAERPRLRRSPALLGADGQRSGARRRYRRPLRPRACRRVSGHESATGVDPIGAEARPAVG